MTRKEYEDKTERLIALYMLSTGLLIDKSEKSMGEDNELLITTLFISVPEYAEVATSDGSVMKKTANDICREFKDDYYTILFEYVGATTLEEKKGYEEIVKFKRRVRREETWSFDCSHPEFSLKRK